MVQTFDVGRQAGGSSRKDKAPNVDPLFFELFGDIFQQQANERDHQQQSQMFDDTDLFSRTDLEQNTATLGIKSAPMANTAGESDLIKKQNLKNEIREGYRPVVSSTAFSEYFHAQ